MLGWDEMLEGGLVLGVIVMLWIGVKGGIEVVCLYYDVIMIFIQYFYFSNFIYNWIKGIKSFGCVYIFEFVFNELVEDE